MGKENEAYEKVLSQIADIVGEMYEKYRRGKGLEDEKDTERQLEILTSKTYISITYISDLSLIADYYARDMIEIYTSRLEEYKIRVLSQIESIPY